MYVLFIVLRLTKTGLTLINRTLRTIFKVQSAGYPQTQNERRSERNPNVKGKHSFVPRIQKRVTFGDISKCHKFTLLNLVTILGFCHTVRIFFSFFNKTSNVTSRKCHKPKYSTGLRVFSDVP